MKHNLLKSLIISVILLTGVTNAWAGDNCDFLDKEGVGDVVYIKYSKNGAAPVQQNIPWNGQSDIDLGEVTSLKITEFRGITKKHDGNVCEVRMHYGINTERNGNISKYLSAFYSNENYNDWTWADYWLVEQYKNSDANLNVVEGLAPGEYYLDFYFTIYGNSGGNSGCYDEQKYWSNNSGNYHISFTYVPKYTVTLAGTDYGTYKVKCGNETYTVGKTPIPINNLPAGTQLTITDIQPNEGYDQTMVYSTDGENYTEFGQEKSLIVNSNITISEDFRTTEEHDIYLKINGDSYTYWINGDDNALPRISFVHRGNLEKKIQDFEKLVVTSSYNIYKVTAPKGYHSFCLYPPHKDVPSDPFDHKIILNDYPTKNCYELTSTATTGEGNWVGATITIQPTGRDADSSNGIGSYGIEYNGTTHYATTTTSQNASFTIPYGASIRVLEGEHDNEAYTNYLITTSNVDKNLNGITDTIYFKGNDTDTIIEVIKDIEFNDFFVSKESHIVYLGVPSTIKNSWEKGDATNKSLAYAEHQYNTSHGAICLIEDQITVNNVTYYKFTIPAGWNNFRFELKTDGDHNRYYTNPIHATIRFPYGIPTDENNCFTLTGGSGHEFTGKWGKAPSHTVELGYCEFGEYSVKYNGKTYNSNPYNNVSFEASFGSEITFVEGTPLQDIYKGGWMLREPNKTRLDATQPYIVKGNVTLDDNFVTRNERVFYFAVPTTKNSDTQWNNAVDKWNKPNAEYYIWTHDDVGSFDMLGDKCHGHPMQSYGTKNGYKYYKFTLPAERNQFRFEHKVPLLDTTTNNSNPTLARTHYLQFQVPTTEKNCYYLTGEYTTSNGTDYYNGYWDILPIDDDQYRLLYVEQVVEKDKENNTVITRKKAHPSDVIKKGIALDTVSLHVYRERSYQGIKRYDEEGPDNNKQHDYYTTKASNAGVILQKTVGGKWVDVSHHMVFGPLEAVPEIALLPGRKNAVSSYSSKNITNLYYDDGIENIKNDDHPDQGNGVWNFVVKKDDSGNVYIALDETHRYKGEYYIRTVAAEGGWENYKTKNQMTRSNISKKNSNFSHYFCKWIGQAETDVQFTIANDYGCAISDTLMSDRTDLWEQRLSESKKMVTALTIPAPANIRFAWNEKTNFIHRAYLSGSTNVSDRFLVLEGDAKIFDAVDGTPLKAGENTGSDPRFGLNDNEEIFKDNNNWLYYADVQMKPMAPVTVTAKYANKVQYFVGKETKDTIMLRGSGDKKYLIRMLYDFKTNELISAYVPYNNASNQVDVITTNLMLIRQDNGETKQLSFASTDMTERVDRRSYGVIEFTKERLINDQKLNPYERSLYWISFPFDVNLQDALSFGTYGTHWIIQEYDGAQRAKDGLWLDSDTFWKYHWNQNITLKANQGYVVALAIDNIKKDGLFDISAGNPIGIYFPSVDYVTNEIINQTNVTTTVPAHKCEINRGTPKGDRTIKDSHWNVIGVPSYANTGANFRGEPFNTIKRGYVYEWLGEPDKYQAISARNYNFKSLYAYMVQYAGELDWTTIVQEQGMFSLSARKESDEQEKAHYLTLELQQNGQKQDYTFIELQEENVTKAFDFNYDLCKINNKGANLYSLIATDTYPVEVAANVLPIEEAIIPLGVVTTTAGEYTFAMPDGTDGIVVELIDYETNTRTNMLLDNYTVNLGKGSFENRFALHVKPDKTTTSVDNIGNEATGDKVKKYLIDGVLYMQKDGVLYDAQGRCVQ